MGVNGAGHSAGRSGWWLCWAQQIMVVVTRPCPCPGQSRAAPVLTVVMPWNESVLSCLLLQIR